MFSESELLPLSAIQHFVFCNRRAALIFIEGLWEDNLPTAEGALLHSRAHEYEVEKRGRIRIVRGLRLHSLELGLSGIADVVEFHSPEESGQAAARGEPGSVASSSIAKLSGFSQPFPIEYKRGKLRREAAYEVQLCAQAMCLEEMLNIGVPCGAIYYGKTGRRYEISFIADLREQTQAAALGLRKLFDSGITPKQPYQPKCEKCSMLPVCLPKVTGRARDPANRYVEKEIKEFEVIQNEASA